MAVDAEGRPSFQLLQNAGGGGAQILFYVFDLLMLKGRSTTAEPLEVQTRAAG